MFSLQQAEVGENFWFQKNLFLLRYFLTNSLNVTIYFSSLILSISEFSNGFPLPLTITSKVFSLLSTIGFLSFINGSSDEDSISGLTARNQTICSVVNRLVLK